MGKLNLKINAKAFTSAKEKVEEMGDDIQLEPGRYEGTVTGVKTPKANLVVIEIKEKESKGRVAVMFSTDEERLHWLIRTLNKFGLQPTDGDELVAALEELGNAKPEIVFSVKEKDGYTNVGIVKMVGEGSDETEEGSTAVDEDAGKPSAGAKAGSPKAKAGKVKKKEEEEEVVDEEVVDEEPVAEEEVDIKPGMKLKATVQGEDGVKVEIVELFEDEGKVIVKRLDNGKKFKISAEKLSL